MSADPAHAERADRALARAARVTGEATPPKAPRRVMRSKVAAEIKPTRVVWLWPGWLPAGRLALLGGRPGDGKSSVTIDLAARATTGSPFPDGYRPPAPLTVLILSGEDDPSDTIVPRLLAAGADLTRVVIANGTVVDTVTGGARSWVLPADVPELANLVRDSGADLVVIDPLAAFVATAVDTHRDSAVRSMLLPLVDDGPPREVRRGRRAPSSERGCHRRPRRRHRGRSPSPPPPGSNGSPVVTPRTQGAVCSP